MEHLPSFTWLNRCTNHKGYLLYSLLWYCVYVLSRVMMELLALWWLLFLGKSFVYFGIVWFEWIYFFLLCGSLHNMCCFGFSQCRGLLGTLMTSRSVSLFCVSRSMSYYCTCGDNGKCVCCTCVQYKRAYLLGD